jgi:hypothetical protein
LCGACSARIQFHTRTAGYQTSLPVCEPKNTLTGCFNAAFPWKFGRM